MKKLDFFWVSVVGIGTLIGCTAAAIVIGCEPSGKLHADPATKTKPWELVEVRIDSCEYIIGWGKNRFGVYAITHKANCDNHGSKP
jgi:hypothetical protein